MGALVSGAVSPDIPMGWEPLDEKLSIQVQLKPSAAPHGGLGSEDGTRCGCGRLSPRVIDDDSTRCGCGRLSPCVIDEELGNHTGVVDHRCGAVSNPHHRTTLDRLEPSFPRTVSWGSVTVQHFLEEAVE